MQNLFFVTQTLLNRKISGFAAWLTLAAALAALAGCGSGQAIPSVPPPAPVTPGTGPDVASIQLLVSSTQIPSSGTNTLDLTAIVLSSNKQTISGKTVTFSTGSDPTAFINNISAGGVSDSNGVVTAKLNLGGNKVNRTITLTATSGTVSASNSVDVTGTTITVSGNGSLAFNATTTLTFSLKDSAGNALSNTAVKITSQTGNAIALTPSSGVTNSSGQVTATITATAAGNDVITASAAGASVTQALTVSSDTFKFTAPVPAAGATTPEIALGTTPTVTVNWTKAGVPQTTGTITFSASRGSIAGGTVTPNSSALTATGDASVNASSTTAGPAIITASGPGGTPAATLNVTYVATSASTATVQAIPGTVQVTTGSAAQTNNSSTISVQVRDAANNLVKNAAVTFNIVQDPSGGYLTSSSGVTDVSGSTSVTYIAGSTSSAQNGVSISATVYQIGNTSITPVVGTTNLTVSGQSLLVRLGTDNLVGGTAPVNTKTYVAIVTDAALNPIVGSKVQFTLRPGRYLKGIFVYDPVNKVWGQVPSTTPACANMDVNFNGILDPGEDAGFIWKDITGAAITPSLRPGAVASVNASGVTDANGVATATITYPKNYSYWAEVTLEARTSVTSNDPPTSTTFYLPGPASDYNQTSPPPGVDSPYGTDTSCFDIF